MPTRQKEDEEKGLFRPFEFAIPFPNYDYDSSENFDGYDILAVQISGWINQGGIAYPGGTVNTLYNKIIFSNMIHIDNVIRHPPVTEKRGSRCHLPGGEPILACCTVVFTAYVYFDNICLAGRT